MARRRAWGQILRRRRNGRLASTWYVRYRVSGREVWESCGPDRKDAEDRLVRLRSDMAQTDNTGLRPIVPISFDDFRPTIESVLRARHAPDTFVAEMPRYGIIAKHFGARPLNEITRPDVEDFLAHLRRPKAEGGRAASGPTCNRYMATLGVVFREAVSRSHARVSPVQGIRRSREALTPVPYLEAAALNRLAAACPPELRPYVTLLAETGLRRREALGLCWDDVDFSVGTVLVRHGKGGRTRVVPLTPKGRQVLGELHADRSPIPLGAPHPVFPALVERRGWITVAVRRAGKRAGLGDDVTPHTLRHAFGSGLARAGVPLPMVGNLLGHSAGSFGNVTYRYARHAPGGAEFDAVAQLAKARGAKVPKPRATRHA